MLMAAKAAQTIDVLKQNGTNATTNEATVVVPGRSVFRNQDGRSWSLRLNAEDKGRTFDITAEIPGGGGCTRGSPSLLVTTTSRQFI